MPRSVDPVLALGLTTSVKHKSVSEINIRAIEYQIAELNSRPHAKPIKLCKRYQLPDGIECASRKLENNGYYSCPQGKEGCPLRG